MLFILVLALSHSLNGFSALLLSGHVFIKCNCIPFSLSFARLTLSSYICLISKTDSPFPSC